MAIRKRRSDVVMNGAETVIHLGESYRQSIRGCDERMREALTRNDRKAAEEEATKKAGYERLLRIVERPQ